MSHSQTVNSELVSTSGDHFGNNDYQIEWSVGECVTATHVSNEYRLSQGFHQSTYVVTLLEDLRSDFEISVYPNPTSDIIFLGIEDVLLKGLYYTVHDISGRTLDQNRINSTKQTIDFANYSLGTYSITISQNNQFIKSFQIIKK